MDSLDHVVNYIDQYTELKPKKTEIQRVMKDELHMSFRKVRRGPLFLNSDRNRICRQ